MKKKKRKKESKEKKKNRIEMQEWIERNNE